MGSRVQRLTRVFILCSGVLLALVMLGAGRNAYGLTFVTETPAERAERLAADWRLLLPAGPGPHPAAMLLSGCDGVRDNMDFWAERFIARGYAALIVDSHTPRGLHRLNSWRLVCAGLALDGGERAGDIAVALQALKAMDDVSGDVVLFGASHGGWAAMEFVAHTVNGDVPPGLSRWPAPPEELLRKVSALILLYPYCGILNGADAEDWSGAPPTKMILAESDTIVSTPSCLERAEALRRESVVETAVIPDADHGFDQREKSALSTLEFRPDQRDAAAHLVDEFLSVYVK